MPYFETIIDCGNISVTFNAVYFPFIDFLLVYFLVVTVAIVSDKLLVLFFSEFSRWGSPLTLLIIDPS